MDVIRASIDKVKIPNNLNDFLKSDTENKVILVGAAGFIFSKYCFEIDFSEHLFIYQEWD